MKTNRVLAAILLSACALPAFAQQRTATPGIDRTQQNQDNRIINGLRSGELTVQEAQNLQRGKNRIEASKQDAKADGVVTVAERRKIKRQQKKMSRKIHNKKHNHRTAS
jgi:hypothetical protein